MRCGENRLHEVNLERKDHLVNPYPDGFSKVEVPAGRSGNVIVRKIKVTDEAIGLHNLRLIRDGYWHRIVPPGDYTQLIVNSALAMADTPAEAHEHLKIYKRARGRVLISGLGLGFVLKSILSKSNVTHVTVLEKSADVIKLVAPTYKNEKVTILNEDVFTWRPTDKFNVAWHDVWNEINDDNREQMIRLKERYAKHVGWQGCWSEEYID